MKQECGPTATTPRDSKYVHRLASPPTKKRCVTRTLVARYNPQPCGEVKRSLLTVVPTVHHSITAILNTGWAVGAVRGAWGDRGLPVVGRGPTGWRKEAGGGGAR